MNAEQIGALLQTLRTGAGYTQRQVPLYLPGDVSRLPGLKLRFRGNMYQMAQMFSLPVPQLNAA